MKKRYKVVVAGLGYFSKFHIDAWSAEAHVDIVGLCDIDPERLSSLSANGKFRTSTDLETLVKGTKADIVDIVAPPSAHNDLIRSVCAQGRTVICQKPFCTSIPEATAVTQMADKTGTQIIIHENFRFQPWHRDIKAFLDAGNLGQVFQARFDFRPGDGRGPDAYLDRQPAFQSMPRFLLYETGVHFIDLFRWYFGDVSNVYAEISRINPAIAGEDAGLMLMQHKTGVRSIFDGNRHSDHVTTNPRRTMGEMTIEGEGGQIRLLGDGEARFRPFGHDQWHAIPAAHIRDDESFGGGCVAALIRHVIQSMRSDREPENTAREYLHVMTAMEAAYASARDRTRVAVENA